MRVVLAEDLVMVQGVDYVVRSITDELKGDTDRPEASRIFVLVLRVEVTQNGSILLVLYSARIATDASVPM